MGLQLLRTLQSQMLKIGFSLVLGVVAIPKEAEAQVVPDGTLKSTVETIQELMKIDGGLTEGSNLFHSFEEFNIPEGMEASFENAVEIENIFTRVTGDSASTINGTLSAQGGANLFLMNPNGIVFGQDASINIGGSFIATTADNIQFQDETEFAATGTEDQTPLLTNEIPIGLGFGSQKSGNITVNGGGSGIAATRTNTPTDVNSGSQGLSVLSGETIGLIGNNVEASGGTITAEGGNVEIGSLSEGEVGIRATDNGYTFNYDNITEYQDVTLSNQSLVDASGTGSGSISVVGNNITLDDGSWILLQNQGSTASGDITINASEALTLEGTTSEGTILSSIRGEAVGTGEGPSINISSSQIQLKDSAIILANTYSEASSGEISISSSESITLQENTSLGSTPLIGASSYGAGDAGSVTLSTQELYVNEGQIASSAFELGDAGVVEINASESVELNGAKKVIISGTGAEVFVPSSIGTGTTGSGNAGTTTFNTAQLTIKDGASIDNSSFASGNAGNIVVNASEFVDVSGQTGDGTPSKITSSVSLFPGSPPEEIETLTGQGGNVTINTSILNVGQGASLNVENQGTGDAGTLNVNAENVSLDDSASITAQSASGTGGNINVQTSGLQLDSDSDITAEAENEAGGGNININATNITAKKNSDISANAEGGDGGNISIDTETLLGLDNSDITANAVEGDGGNINITATSILGYEERPELTPLSDITASSEFGVDGTININSPETNAEEDVQVSAKKPEAPLTPLEFVKGCRLPEGILTTRGRGVPESPYPFPFGYLDHDRDVYKLAEETLRKERERKQREERENGISKREAEERRKARELAMLREKQRLLPNRHEHLMYEVTDNRDEGAMLLPAPKGKLVEPADGRTDKNAIPAFYSESNELPPISQEKRLRQEGNVLVINPDGSKHFVRMFLMSHPSEEMCETTVGLN